MQYIGGDAWQHDQAWSQHCSQWCGVSQPEGRNESQKQIQQAAANPRTSIDQGNVKILLQIGDRHIC